MQTDIILTGISINDFKFIVAECVSNELQKFKPHPDTTPPVDDLIKIDEVAQMFNVSKVTIFAWKKSGKIPFYRIANKIYFKRNEVFDALKKIEKKVV